MKTAIKRTLLMLLMIMMVVTLAPNLGMSRAYAADDWIEGVEFTTDISIPNIITVGDTLVQPKSGDITVDDAYGYYADTIDTSLFTIDYTKSGWYHFFSEDGEYVKYGEYYDGEIYGGDYKFLPDENQFRVCLKYNGGSDYVFDEDCFCHLNGRKMSIEERSDSEITVALNLYDLPTVTEVWISSNYDWPWAGQDVFEPEFTIDKISGTAQIPSSAISVKGWWCYYENNDYWSYPSGSVFRKEENQLMVGVYIEDDDYALDNQGLVVYLNNYPLRDWTWAGNYMAQKCDYCYLNDPTIEINATSGTSDYNGTVSFDNSSWKNYKMEYFPLGSTVTLYAQDGEGCEFTAWRQGSSTGPVVSTDKTYSFTMTGPDEYYAIFEKSVPGSGKLCSTVDYTFDESTGTITLIPTGSDDDGLYGYAEVEGGYGSSPFYSNSKIRHIILQEGIRSMNDYVFENNTGIQTVSIPSTFTSIRDRAFEDCNIVGDGFTVAAGNKEFKAQDGQLLSIDGKQLIKASLKPGQTEYTVPEGLTGIWSQALEETTLNKLTLRGDNLYVTDYAFDSCDIGEIIIEEGVKSIGYMRCNNRAESITIPASLTYIDQDGGVVDSKNMKNIYVTSGNSTYESLDGILCEKQIDGGMQTGKNIYAYPNGRTATSLEIPEGVTGITGYAFQGNEVLKEITLPLSVAKIGYRAFAFMDGVTITIKNAECEIDNWAFDYSENITIRGVTGSTAQIIAEEKGFNFESIGSGETPETLPSPQNLRWDGTTAKWDPIPGIEGVRYNVKYYEGNGSGEPYHVEFYDRVITDGSTEWNEFVGRMAYADQDYFFTVQATKSGYYSSEVVWSPAGHGPFTIKTEMPTLTGDTITFHTGITTDVPGIYDFQSFIYVYDMDGNKIKSEWSESSYTEEFNLRSFFKEYDIPYGTYKLRASMDASYYGWSQTLAQMPEEQYLTYEYKEIPKINRIDVALPPLAINAQAHNSPDLIIKTLCGDIESDGVYPDSYYYQNCFMYQEEEGDSWEYFGDAGIQKDKYAYGYKLELRKRSGYEFSGEVEVYVNGVKVEPTDSGSSYIRVEYYYPEGTQPKSGWILHNGSWYYYNADGTKATGWKKVSKKWYYMDGNGIMQTGWQKIGTKWYYFNASGVMQTGWVKISGKWYYFNTSGVMQTGWQVIGGKDYFFKSSGAMAANEWVKGYWWLNKDGTWTYKYKGSWKKSGGKWWFGDTSGWYAKNTTITIDGKKYTFDAKGYLV